MTRFNLPSVAEVTLKNGAKIFCLHKGEAQFMAEEVKEYLKHGIEIQEGDTIFDVGANIGVFTIWAYQLCDRNANIYAFEPIPKIFDVLFRNARRFNFENLKVFPYGLAQEPKTATFAYYPAATLWSSADLDFSKEQIEESKNAVLRNIEATPLWFQRLPGFLRKAFVDYMFGRTTRNAERVTCQLRTLSEVVREQCICQIDLLKIDVEKGELDVLLGIEERDWPKIKQVAIEVHDVDRRVETISALLKARGLDAITVDQQPILKGSSVFLLYAKRQ
ncbi:FkbM family methyltransferase [Pseudanabaena sp. PCC 6802]|uniref:FkbM family methyltransferase n=1 Tax=Pseudanabaena sp. PCC 6802 TaxID=118173 RepID=UPI00034A8FE6|nr:FkbM family methyltransferase [Pseudanabaena sp. PCC 6802]